MRQQGWVGCRAGQTGRMIVLRVRWNVRPEFADDFLARIADFSAACRAEPGCLRFEWTSDGPRTRRFVLLEAYRGWTGLAGHLTSGHFFAAFGVHRRYATGLPRLLSVRFPRDPAALNRLSR